MTDRLLDAIAPDLRAATKAYLTSHNAAAFERAMQRALAKAHTAAYIRGTADRTGILVKARVSEQADFLRGFVQAAPDLSEAQVAQRAALYLGAVRATYYGARFPGLPSYPGDGQTACRTNCRCQLEERDGGVWWIMGSAEHCDDCRERAAGSPYGAMP